MNAVKPWIAALENKLAEPVTPGLPTRQTRRHEQQQAGKKDRKGVKASPWMFNRATRRKLVGKGFGPARADDVVSRDHECEAQVILSPAAEASIRAHFSLLKLMDAAALGKF